MINNWKIKSLKLGMSRNSKNWEIWQNFVKLREKRKKFTFEWISDR